MRGLLAFLILWPLSGWALEARVLIDDSSPAQTITGGFTLQCFDPLRRQSACARSLQYTFDHAIWNLQSVAKGLRIKNQQTGEVLMTYGHFFLLNGSLRLQDRQFSALSFYRHDKKNHWVLHLEVDQYLYGVLAAEVPSSWPMESLKAQAIASRTYFLFKKLQRLKEPYDVRSDTLDQVFHVNSKKHQNIIAAVDSTHGMILIDQKSEAIFPAYFHSDCGGHTSSEAKVWRKPAAYNTPVKDPYCASAAKNDWRLPMAKTELMATLQKAFYLPHGVELLKVLPRVSEETRAHVVDFLFSGDILKRISANELRKVLGFGKLKSTLFEVEQSWDEIVFKGRGFGHGVGLCQWGAQRWARQGKDHLFILKHYYPEARLTRVDPKAFQELAAHLIY